VIIRNVRDGFVFEMSVHRVSYTVYTLGSDGAGAGRQGVFLKTMCSGLHPTRPLPTKWLGLPPGSHSFCIIEMVLEEQLVQLPLISLSVPFFEV
jgi:hypothetical protein